MPDHVLEDLSVRLKRTRLPRRTGSSPWAAGVDPDYLRGLLAYWATDFDWRRAERRLNALPHFRVEIAGQRVHFLHVRGVKRPLQHESLPLILSHGWPSSFVEMLPLVPLLTDPTAHGADAEDTFDVVIPSLPGFLFSDLPATRPMTRAHVADTWASLMTGVLGYERFGAFGGDIGGGITAWLGAAHADRVVGIHLIHPPFPPAWDPPMSAVERAYVDAEEAFDRTDGGYSAIQATRPDTLAAALMDSPSGLAAWILDKYRAWSDCDGDLASRFERDTLLTILTLYWATESIGSSFWNYYDYEHNPPRPTITVPAAVTLSAEPVMRSFPRVLAERSLADIRLWNQPSVGGHFMPMEEPQVLANDIRSFFRPLRSSP